MSEPMAHGSKRRKRAVPVISRRLVGALGLILLSALIAIVYGNSIKAPFVYDDRIHILENLFVRAFHLAGVMPAISHVLSNSEMVGGRQLLVLTYGMNYMMSGADPEASRWTNLAIHALNSTLVLMLVLELAPLITVDSTRRVWLAGLAAALFACHPLLIESVTYITGRSSSLCATFYFAGLYLILRTGRAQGS